jgi:diguanylate cyclase (GGDEF)-like protein
MLDTAILESLVHDSPDPVVVLKSNRTIESLNPALARLAAGAKAGLDFMALVAPAARDRVLAQLVKVAGGAEQLVSVPHAKGDDETVVEYRFLPCDGGRVAGMGRVRGEPADLVPALTKAQAELKAQASVLDRIQLELTQVPFIDPVTGVWNRMQVIERLTGEWSRSERYGSPIACLMVDVESVEAVRRRDGAVVADEILKAVARRLRSVVRDHDVVGRYGGDRLVIVAVQSDAEGARSLARRISEAVESEPLSSASGVSKVSLRIGGATNRSEGVEILEDLFTVAESALSEARRAKQPHRISSDSA